MSSMHRLVDPQPHPAPQRGGQVVTRGGQVLAGLGQSIAPCAEQRLDLGFGGGTRADRRSRPWPGRLNSSISWTTTHRSAHGCRPGSGRPRSRRNGPAPTPCPAPSTAPGPSPTQPAKNRSASSGSAVHTGRPRNRTNSKITARSLATWPSVIPAPTSASAYWSTSSCSKSSRSPGERTSRGAQRPHHSKRHARTLDSQETSEHSKHSTLVGNPTISRALKICSETILGLAMGGSSTNIAPKNSKQYG